MSTQPNAGIPLSHAPDGVGYKLLELPPEVVELLESPNPPTLTLHPSPTAALLKTTLSDGSPKTYSLRQKNTSNGLILLSPLTHSSSSPPQPHHSRSENKQQETDEMDIEQTQEEEEGIPIPGLRTLATLHETIELVPEAENAEAPAVKARGKWHERFARGR
ncbi:hypothetical protein B0T20DRAFT_407587 [Sordaria brevicollis]|uniref:Sister chromatid cohesion protein DCC1 n=1 Tax=Sordaria brevicollis TaxID=83679 RepID=A0AAE0PHH4_SORBR|nr:hypothetical protein B0T20DRAFT_407587 [Sordaria brevicollis]